LKIINLKLPIKDNKDKNITNTKSTGDLDEILCEEDDAVVGISDGVLQVNVDDPWHAFNTLLSCTHIYELFSTPSATVASIRNMGRVALRHPLSLEEIISHLVEETGARIDLAHPYTSIEYNGWRIFMQLEPQGQLELDATRISSIPPLTSLMDPLLAARTLTLLMAPSTAVIVGPPGSGKSTLLNSMLLEIAYLWPNLHVAIVEPVKELILQGGWASRMEGPVSKLVRLTVRYKRPDILAVGELSTDDVWSFIEAGRSGIPTISTYHSPNIWKCLQSMADAISLHIPGAKEYTVLRYIDLFIITRRIIDRSKITRHVSSVYLSDGQRLIPIYIYDTKSRHLSEEKFIEKLPMTSILGDAKQLYENLKPRHPVKGVFEDLPPLLPISKEPRTHAIRTQ